MLGLAMLGLWLGGNARASIGLLDGGTNTTASTASGETNISLPFSVSQGASVMVVALYADNNNPNYPGPDLVWSNTTSGATQLLSLCVATNTAWIMTWANIYYLWNPSPGTGVITGTDTNTAVANLRAMLMQAYTLSGVDTNVAPFGLGNSTYQQGNASTANILLADTSPSTVSGSWAAAMGVGYNGGGGNDVTLTCTSGSVVSTNYHPDGLQCTMGYLTDLAPGVSTITATGTGGPQAMDWVAAVFAPRITVSSPTSLVATPQTHQVLLSWADSSGGVATGYIVLRSPVSGSGYTAMATHTGNTSTTYTDTSVIDWTPYYYVVQGLGPGGVSPNSAQVAGYGMGLPATVTGLTAVVGVKQVALSWNNQLGADSFNVWRSTTSGSGFTTVGSSATNSYTDTSVDAGTLYYYKVSGANSYGTGADSTEVSAVPVVAFFTNSFGIFNSDADVAGWTTTAGTATAMFYADAPVDGPSSGCLVMSATYGPGGTAASQGLGTQFSPSLNLSTYKYIELDIKNQGLSDQWGQIQAIQLNLQVPVNDNPTYARGTWGDITLYASVTGGAWTHYTAPMTNWAAYDLTSVTAFAINIYDGNCLEATELDPSFANVRFSGAPAWAPAFSVANKTAASGSTRVTLTGKVSGTVAGAPVYLWTNTTISVTINESTQTTAINDSTGDFSIDFNTTGFADGTYPVTYTSPADMVGLIGATNSSTTLTLTALLPPTSPVILPPLLDGAGANMVLRVATQSGYNYLLLSTTNLDPPVVWATNSITAGTGGTITNLVPITKSQQCLFLKYLVQ